MAAFSTGERRKRPKGDRWVRESTRVPYDMNYIEDAGGGPDLAVAVHPNLDKVAMLQMDAKVSMEVFEKVLELAQDGCKAIATHMRQALLEHTQQLAASRGNLR
eukprot:jgi/Chlat1/8906/Chrsp92S08220